MIQFNGVSSGTLGCYVEHYPARPIPKRKSESFSVPGRSGDVIAAQDAWENVEQSYDIYLSAEAAGLPIVSGRVVEWLMQPRGYARLEDDYNPDIFRLAVFLGGADLKNTLNAFGRATLKFNCQPQRWLKSGETPWRSDEPKTAGPAAVVTFSDGQDDDPVAALSVAIKAVQSGSGDPSPSNIRPITGWTGANVTRTGKNLFDISSVSTTHSGNWGIAVDGDKLTVTHKNAYWTGVPVVRFTLPAGTYTLYGGAQQATGIELRKNGSYVANVTASYTFTVDEGDTIELLFYLSAAGTIVFKQIQLEVGSTATTYEPYSGDTYAISWQTEAGTVYGGTLDVTTGLLTVTDAQIASYAGETLPGEWISDRDVYAAGTTPSTGAQVVYALAAPQTYQLTPVEVTTLLGTNSIWADTGDTSAAYFPPPTLVNPTGFPALPLIVVHGSGSGTVTVGAATVSISAITDGMVLDCVEGEAYAESGGTVSNLNAAVSGDFPVLGAGETAISFTGGVTAVEITPRWYEI